MHITRIRTGLSPKEADGRLEGMDAIALSCAAAASIEEIALASHLAKKAFEKKTNIANKLRYEFLLWLSGKRDIRSAIRETAPVAGEEMVVVVFGEAKDVAAKLEGKELPLGLPPDGEPMRLERISLSRIRG